jgi:AhpD family alkylhydroperoxidase
MQRIRAILDAEQTEETRRRIAEAETKGAPDPRIAAVFARGDAGLAWMEFWQRLMNQGVLAHRLKELVRIRMSVAQHCGYCSSIRTARGQAEGLTEELIADSMDLETSTMLTEKEKAAIRFSLRFKAGEVTRGETYEDIRRHFNEVEVLELAFVCWQVDGGGKMAKLINVVSWDEACSLNPAFRKAKDDAERAVPA